MERAGGTRLPPLSGRESAATTRMGTLQRRSAEGVLEVAPQASGRGYIRRPAVIDSSPAWAGWRPPAVLAPEEKRYLLRALGDEFDGAPAAFPLHLDFIALDRASVILLDRIAVPLDRCREGNIIPAYFSLGNGNLRSLEASHASGEALAGGLECKSSVGHLAAAAGYLGGPLSAHVGRHGDKAHSHQQGC